MPRPLKGLRSRYQPSRLHHVGARCEGATEPTVALRLGWERKRGRKFLNSQHRRRRILSADVADAIEALVGPPERRSLPAFDKNAIVQKLVEIAHTEAVFSMTETFLNRRLFGNR